MKNSERQTLPLDSIRIMDNELMFVLGGQGEPKKKRVKEDYGCGCKYGAGCGCGCECGGED